PVTRTRRRRRDPIQGHAEEHVERVRHGRLTVWLISLIVRFFYWLRHERGKPPVMLDWTLPRLTNEMDRIERLLLEGDAGHSGQALSQIESPVMTLQGPDGLIPRARFR